MEGWILQRDVELRMPSYETQRLISAAAAQDIDLQWRDARAVNVVVSNKKENTILLNNQPHPLPDFIIPRMGATTNYDSFAVIRFLESQGVYSLNTALSIEVAKDKLRQLQVLSTKDFPIPKTHFVRFPIDSTWTKENLGFPVVLKAISGTQGSGVFLCKDENSFYDVLGILQIANREVNLILQEYISKSKGRDLRVYVVGDKAVSAMERYSDSDNFKANFSIGGKVRAFKLTPEIEELAVGAAKAIGLELAGVDLLFDNDGTFKICEINSSPGFRGMETATGKNIAKEIISYVKEKATK